MSFEQSISSNQSKKRPSSYSGSNRESHGTNLINNERSHKTLVSSESTKEQLIESKSPTFGSKPPKDYIKIQSA